MERTPTPSSCQLVPLQIVPYSDDELVRPPRAYALVVTPGYYVSTFPSRRPNVTIQFLSHPCGDDDDDDDDDAHPPISAWILLREDDGSVRAPYHTPHTRAVTTK